jgi:transposase-like protein
MPVTPDARLEIITSVKSGTPVTEAATKHNVAASTIRKWMHQGANNAHSSSSELQKAKKRIEFLESVVLDLVLEQKALARKV